MSGVLAHVVAERRLIPNGGLLFDHRQRVGAACKVKFYAQSGARSRLPHRLKKRRALTETHRADLLQDGNELSMYLLMYLDRSSYRKLLCIRTLRDGLFANCANGPERGSVSTPISSARSIYPQCHSRANFCVMR